MLQIGSGFQSYCRLSAALLIFVLSREACADQFPLVKPSIELRNSKAIDQDDMCLWTHPSVPSQSLVIASDKKGNGIFVYNLKGETVQMLPISKPGNIDIRQRVAMGGETRDIVAVNLRKERKIAVFKVNPMNSSLERIDKGDISTGSNYGGTLYRSPKTQKLYFLCTSEDQNVEQFELSDDGHGHVAGHRVRNWAMGKCEGAVGDDFHGKIYIAEEDNGIWELGGEPDDPTPGKLFVKLGDHGIQKDLEGITIYPTTKERGYLIVSSQGRNLFYVFDRQAPHKYLGAFQVQGAQTTDGIDVVSGDWGPQFPQGVFACHTDSNGRPLLLTSWERIAKSMTPQLLTRDPADPGK
jgi:3-phytase